MFKIRTLFYGIAAEEGVTPRQLADILDPHFEASYKGRSLSSMWNLYYDEVLRLNGIGPRGFNRFLEETCEAVRALCHDYVADGF